MEHKILESLVKRHNNSSRGSTRKIPVYIRLSPLVIDYFKSQGPGYQARINELLVDFVNLAQAAGVNSDLSASEISAGAGAGGERLRLARTLFQKYHAQCFWHLRKNLEITDTHIPLIVEGLRRHGGREGFLEAMQLCQ